MQTNWESPSLVVSSLVLCNFYAEALFGAYLRPFKFFSFSSYFCLCYFALICVFLRQTALGI